MQLIVSPDLLSFFGGIIVGLLTPALVYERRITRIEDKVNQICDKLKIPRDGK